MAVLVDTYTDTNGTLLIPPGHTSDNGRTYAVYPQKAFIVSTTSLGGTIQNNRLYSATDTLCVQESSGVYQDVDITFDVYIASVPGNNYVIGPQVRMSSTTGTLVVGCLIYFNSWVTSIRRYIAGGYLEYIASGLGGAAQPTVGSTHTMRFKVVGPQYDLYYDGNLAASANNSEIAAPGRIGLYIAPATSTTAAHLDNITVESLDLTPQVLIRPPNRNVGPMALRNRFRRVQPPSMIAPGIGALDPHPTTSGFFAMF